MSSAESGLFQPAPRQLVLRDLLARSRRRLVAMDEGRLAEILEDALYNERKRLENRVRSGDGPERDRLDRLARALVRGDGHERVEIALELVAAWGEEIHGRFDPRVYRFATRMLPRALTGLLTARPERLRDWDLSPDRRIRVTGNLELLRELSREATLILAPTHVSNLDSPLIGLALYQAGLPPFVYGAGLNLFSNRAMGFFMRRLGAYTVDRTKKARLYKGVLLDYSIRCLATRHHSLFFPGGTRARSGAIESRAKKGLLGTGVAAWQEMLEARRRDAEVYVVPLTLSCQLVLEAATLIDDHLAEAGKQRYIISDDEFARPGRVASFARRVLDLDTSMVACFGDPIDCLGNPVPTDPAERAAEAVRRRRYVCDKDGDVQRDEQRDRVYTDRLAESLVRAWPRGAYVQATHLAAWVAWRCLETSAQVQDPFRLVRVPPEARRVPRTSFLRRLATALREVSAGAEEGRWRSDLPPSADAVLDTALDRFARYHTTFALVARGDDIVVEDPKLCLYYRNRLLHAGLEA
jgi:glycerol-3-phosphate O-acyltransferase